MLDFVSVENNSFDVYHGRVYLGAIYKEADGNYVFWDKIPNGGSWESPVLHEIIDKIDEMNLPWDDDKARYYTQQKFSGQLPYEHFCRFCNNMVDTPQHELGCDKGNSYGN